MTVPNNNFALFRRPGEDFFTAIHCESPLSSLQPDFEGHEGFLIHPFSVSGTVPVVFISADQTFVEPLRPAMNANPALQEGLDCSGLYASYSESFEAFHTAVGEGSFKKLVLSRSHRVVPRAGYEIDALQSFFNACERYPEMMVMLFSTSITGTWLIASPEILLEGNPGSCRTMALAGTMNECAYGGWSDKNRLEQDVVCGYIMERMKPLCSSISKNGPYTSRAGNLFHLKTDIEMSLADGIPFLKAALALHPTPALCGLPSDGAKEFIMQNEKHESGRLYYGGFCGPVNVTGNTSLYVSIRCARLDDGGAWLYAGGGIMPQSECREEYEETENKMKTIASCIATRKI